MERLLLSLVVGAGVVASSVHRTLSVGRGDVKQTFLGAVANSIAYYLSVQFIVQDDISGYIGTCVGSILILMFMAYRNKKRDEKNGNSKK